MSAARSRRRSVTRNKNRTPVMMRLRLQMLTPALGQVQLEAPDIFSRRGVGGAIEKRSKPLAAVNVAPLRAGTELARVHVLDHPMTQRGDGVRTHGNLLSGVR